MSLRDRLLGKIVMPGPATPCATWIGAYNRPSARSARAGRKPAHRPVIRAEGRRAVIYVAPLMLTLAEIIPEHPDQTHAAHRWRMGVPINGVYSCVDLDCLRWASPAENEADKYEL